MACGEERKKERETEKNTKEHPCWDFAAFEGNFLRVKFFVNGERVLMSQFFRSTEFVKAVKNYRNNYLNSFLKKHLLGWRFLQPWSKFNCDGCF